MISTVQRGVGTGPANPETPGPKFPVHQEFPQLFNNCNQATLIFLFIASCLY